MKNRLKKLLLTLFLTIILYFIACQIKNNVINTAEYSNALFSLSYVTNTGSAFGMLQNNSFILSIFGIVVLILTCFYVYKTDKITKIENVLIVFFLAGALGNIIERITLGYVVDYIKLNFIDFPVFNLYDAMISCSVFMYLILYFRDLNNEDKNDAK